VIASALRVAVDDWPTALRWDSHADAVWVGTAAGSVVRAPLQGEAQAVRAHRGAVRAIEALPGGAAVSLGEDGALCWSVGGELTREIVLGRGWAGALARSAEGLLAASVGALVHLLSAEGERLSTRGPHDSTIAELAFRPDGQKLAVAAYGGVTLHDVRGSRARHLPWTGSMLSVVWRRGAKADVIACGCQDSSVHFWRLPGGEDAQMAGYPAKPDRLSFRHDGGALATNGDETICVWPFDGQGPIGRPPVQLQGHEGLVRAVTFSPGVELLATGADDGLVKLWVPSRTTRTVESLSLGGRVEHLAFAVGADALWLAAACSEGQVAVWRLG
jgi:WD40 repeat protein